MPRFVVLHHDWPSPHYDLLLEAGEVLKAWRLLGNPDSLPVFAEQNHDHRLDYLDYEGPLSDDRGTVIRWDFGQYSVNSESENGVWIEMQGRILSGSYVVMRLPRGWKFEAFD